MRTNICAIKNNFEKHVIFFIYRLYIYNHNRGTCVNKTRKFWTYKLKENKNNDRNVPLTSSASWQTDYMYKWVSSRHGSLVN